MKIAVAKEIDPLEPRVAASPDTVCEMSLETSSAFIAGAARRLAGMRLLAQAKR